MQARLTMWAHSLAGRLRREDGQGMVEYGILLAFVAAVGGAVFVATGAGSLGGAINGAIQSAITAL
jgi:Flp pilus assembly pilin Flp